MKILIVEDNKKLAKSMKTMLERELHVIEIAYDGLSGLYKLLNGSFDLALLDYMLPEKDGISITKEARESGILIPIILVTARDSVSDRIEGLDSGADDYMVKPFAMIELAARVRALLRRPVQQFQSIIEINDLTLDPKTHRVTVSGSEVLLTVKEFMVLEYLMSQNGNTVTREQILDHCWDFAFDSFSNIVDVYIKQLRTKLEHNDKKYIKTIRGVGYQCGV